MLPWMLGSIHRMCRRAYVAGIIIDGEWGEEERSKTCASWFRFWMVSDFWDRLFLRLGLGK
jgi:hypothetical protein